VDFFTSFTRGMRALVRSRSGLFLLACFAAGLIFAADAYSKGSRKANNEQRPRTPLELAEFKRLSTSEEITAYLARLDQKYSRARVETLGTSVQGRPIQALVLSKNADADVSTPGRLTVLLIGCQHGTESAGAESLLFVARDLLTGPLQKVIDDIDVVLIPNANPDGRDNGKRANANGINLNIDFVSLTQPESVALIDALQRYRPEVSLDVHESAVLKKKSLAREGYMTDFMVQFEFANNPNIATALQTFSRREVLGPLIADVNAAGLRCHRYIGEIKSIHQAVTNGGLTLQNLRNRMGIEGTLAFLMESRLDPSGGDYPTFRNIRQRVHRQRVSVESFLKLVHKKRTAALAAVAAARPQSASVPLSLDAKYVAGLGHPRVKIDMLHIADNKLVAIEFPDHRSVAVDTPLAMPRAYVIRDHQADIAALLDRHGIAYSTLTESRSEWAVEFVPGNRTARAKDAAEVDKLRERPMRLRADSGDLWISVDQPRGRLAALLLEPRSTSSLFRSPAYKSLVSPGKSLGVVRVPR
jgi:hypothetical protein